ncbi:MAG TPA: hypothetical protein VGP47_07145 [Parachlamydiaceae bacterium]|nr:hypothetical protein [Parachlamydiaceae bacterium]
MPLDRKFIEARGYFRQTKLEERDFSGAVADFMQQRLLQSKVLEITNIQ